jgi:hypothetical protein
VHKKYVILKKKNLSLCSKYIIFYGGITPVHYVDMSKEYIVKPKGEPYQAHTLRPLLSVGFRFAPTHGYAKAAFQAVITCGTGSIYQHHGQ